MIIEPAKRTASVAEYYFSRKLAEVRSLDTAERRVINLGIGSPDLAPPPGAIEVLAAGLDAPGAHKYQPYRGAPELRAAIASLYRGTFQVDLDADLGIVPLMGSKEAILQISLAFLDEGDEVLIPDPGYPTYRSAATLAGGAVKTYSIREGDADAIDLDELEALDLARVKILWLNFPHMPTGRTTSRRALEAVVRLARRHRVLLVNDNPYGLLTDGAPLSLLSIDGASEVALELGSLSKSHNMAGWRVGWMAGAAPLIDTVMRVRTNADSGMFLPIQRAAAAALASGAAWLDDLRGIYGARRLEGEALLDALGCEVAGGQSGVFVWAKAPDAIADVEAFLDEVLRETRVFLAPGTIFGERGRRHVRLSLCNPIEEIGEARARIEELVRRRDRRLAS